MNKTLYIFGLVAIMAMVSGCRDMDEPQRLQQPGTSTLRVKVMHPTLGSGPNFLVKVYPSLDAANADQPVASAVTNLNGDVRFTRLHSGEGFVECVIAGNPQLWDRDTLNLPFNDSISVTLRPMPRN